MDDLFFEASRSAYRGVSEVFDFVWPASAALWNLRWQVAGLTSVKPDVTVEDLNHRFIVGSGIYGANLKRACIELTWSDQQQQFARFLLVQVFGIFEGWLGAVLEGIGHTRLEKALQFPTHPGKGGAPEGAAPALVQIKASPSMMIQTALYPKLTQHPKNGIANLDNLLITYRCFKECRNALMHNGGIADNKAVVAWQNYTSLTAAALGVKEVPTCPAVVLGTPVELSLRGVVGFTAIILRLIATYDAELACAANAEREFLARWTHRFKSRPVLKTKDLAARERQIIRLVHKVGFPRPTAIPVIEQYLINHRLATY
jgi:hypothetical protein